MFFLFTGERSITRHRPDVSVQTVMQVLRHHQHGAGDRAHTTQSATGGPVRHSRSGQDQWLGLTLFTSMFNCLSALVVCASTGSDGDRAQSKPIQTNDLATGIQLPTLPVTRGQYHGGRRPSSDDKFSHSNRHSTIGTRQTDIMKRYHHRPMMRWGVTARSPTMVTLYDTRFVECRWRNDDWSVKTVVTWRSTASMIPAPGQC